MTSSISFSIVDVFAKQKYHGNPLAVIKNAESLSDNEMQAIAKEMNYSETTFILPEESTATTFRVRIFTPERELPFAGHPTLGTAFIIQQELVKKKVETITLDLQIGSIPVRFRYRNNAIDEVWMQQYSPSFGGIADKKRIAKMLGLYTTCIDTEYPVQLVSTGIPFLIVPLKSLHCVEQVKINKIYQSSIGEHFENKPLLVFSPETADSENDLHVRVFVDCYGIPEDPATGSGNGCLSGYLLKHNYYGQSSVALRIEQGYELGRPSLIYSEASMKNEELDIRIGGNVVLVGEGTLF
jgi:trans-2,3-dihydro-3-hydroxyanthranilate isomerase